MDYESTCYRKNEESLKRSKKRNETTPSNQEKEYLTTASVTRVWWSWSQKFEKNALETSEHEECFFFHNCSHTFLYIHSKQLLYATIYDISQLF